LVRLNPIAWVDPVNRERRIGIKFLIARLAGSLAGGDQRIWVVKLGEQPDRSWTFRSGWLGLLSSVSVPCWSYQLETKLNGQGINRENNRGFKPSGSSPDEAACSSPWWPRWSCGITFFTSDIAITRQVAAEQQEQGEEQTEAADRRHQDIDMGLGR
jgi:hypothetical protein